MKWRFSAASWAFVAGVAKDALKRDADLLLYFENGRAERVAPVDGSQLDRDISRDRKGPQSR